MCSRKCSSAFGVTATRSTRAGSCRGCGGVAIDRADATPEQLRADAIHKWSERLQLASDVERASRLRPALLYRQPLRGATRMKRRAQLCRFSQPGVCRPPSELAEHVGEREVDFRTLERSCFVFAHLEQRLFDHAALEPLGESEPELVVFRGPRLEVEAADFL